MKPNKYEYSLRFQLDPKTDVEHRINRLVDFCQKAEIDDVMFFVDAEDINHGHCTIEQVKPQIEAIKKAGEQIKKLGVTLSLNPWASLLHEERGRTLKVGQNFNTMVDYKGYKSKVVACPLCEEWRKYFVELYKYYCTELDIDTIWIEDDFRLHNHAPLEDVGCFCQLHMQKYSQALGKTVTREQFVQGLVDNVDGYRKAYLSVNRDVMESAMRYIIDELKGVQDGFGLMTSGANAYFVEGRDQVAMFQIMSERRQALNRLSLGMYRQDSSIKYGWILQCYMMLARKTCGDNQLVVGEIENFPMTLTCKSTKFTAFQMEMTLPLCLKGQTYDIFEFNGNGVTNGDAFAKQLSSRKKFFQSFLDSGCKFGDLKGVKSLYSPLTTLYKKNKKGKPSGMTPNDTFLAGILACMGISVEYTDSIGKGQTVAVSGEVLRTLNQEQIINLFKENTVILSGTSLSVLCELGLSGLIGVKEYTVIEERNGVVTYEQGVDESVMKIPDERSSCQFFTGDYIKVDFEEKANIHDYTEIRDFDNKRVGHGICSVNQRVIILPYMEVGKKKTSLADEYPLGLITPLRSRAMYNAINNAGKGEEVVRVGLENVTPYYFKEKDVIVFNNYSDDDYERLIFQCEEDYRFAEISARDGRSGKLEIKIDGNEKIIGYPVLGCSSVFVKLYK